MTGFWARAQLVSLPGGRARLGCSDSLRCHPRHTQAASQQTAARHAKKTDSIKAIQLDDGTTLYSFGAAAAPKAEPAPKAEAGPPEVDLTPKHVISHAPSTSLKPADVQPLKAAPKAVAVPPEVDLAPKRVISRAPSSSRKSEPADVQPRKGAPEKQESATLSVREEPRDKTAGISLVDEGSADGDQDARGLKDMTVKQLTAVCKERGISGYSKLRKAQLVQLLSTQA